MTGLSWVSLAGPSRTSVSGPQVAKVGNAWGGGDRNRQDVPRSPAVFMLTSMDPPPTAKPTFPTSRAS